MSPPMQQALTLLLGNPGTGKTHWARQNGKVECYRLHNTLPPTIKEDVAQKLAQGHAWGELAISAYPCDFHTSNRRPIPPPTDEEIYSHLESLWPGKEFVIRRFEHQYA